jgi:FkbM family methyltransferase
VPAETILNMRGAVRIAVPGSLAQTSTYVLLEQEDWFEEEIGFVRRWLRPGMKAIDVGACLGVYTATMARAVAPGGSVWAFEPAPGTLPLLSRTLELNGMSHVKVEPAAVSDRPGSVAFALEERGEEHSILRDGQSADDVIEVPTVTLDQMAREHRWGDVDFVKLDVEGHEIAALHGAAEFLRSQSPVVMLEIKAKARMDFSPLRLLADFGYRPYRLHGGLQALVPFDAQAVDPSLLNLFACKPDRAASLAADGFLCEGLDRSARAPGVEAWTDYAGGAAYCAKLARRWPTKAGFLSQDGLRPYLRGLAAYIESRNTRRSLGERYALMRLALELVQESLGSGDSLARRISFSRLLDEALGERDAAARSMGQVLEALGERTADAIAEPLLAPSARFEHLRADEDSAAWLYCAVTEYVEKRRNYSSMFTMAGTRALIERIQDNPFRSAEMERRWQLVKMARGLQDGPRPTPLLCRRSEENLNPEFWCASGQG